MGKVTPSKVPASVLSTLGSVSAFLDQAGFAQAAEAFRKECEGIGITALPKLRRGKQSVLDEALAQALEGVLAWQAESDPNDDSLSISRESEPQEEDGGEYSLSEASSAEHGSGQQFTGSFVASPHKSVLSSEHDSTQGESPGGTCSSDEETEELIPHSFQDLRIRNHVPMQHTSNADPEQNCRFTVEQDTISHQGSSCSVVRAARFREEGRRRGRCGGEEVRLTGSLVAYSRAALIAELRGHREPLLRSSCRQCTLLGLHLSLSLSLS
jgi:hypothetical protein